jgi:hypothetical protein
MGRERASFCSGGTWIASGTDGWGDELGGEQKCETWVVFGGIPTSRQKQTGLPCACETSRQTPARGGHDTAGTRVIPGERAQGNPVLKLSRAENPCDDVALP